MQRSVKSPQRKVRILAFRIEGSTGTPTLEGLDANQCTIVDNGIGDYTVTFNQAFAEAPHAVASCEAEDKVATVEPLAASVTINVNDIDTTPALSEGDVQVIVIGHDIADNY